MGRSLKVSLALLAFVTMACGGFFWGRALGARSARYARPQGISAIFRPGLAGGIADTEPNLNVPPDQVFEDVLDKVQHEFVDGTGTNARLSSGALSRMLASLDDPRTSYLEPLYRQKRQEALRGHFYGIGAALSVEKVKKADVEHRQLTVVDVMPGSPAAKAGLRSHDVITHIDGRWIIAYAVSVEVDRIPRSTSAQDEDARAQEAKAINSRFQKGMTLTRALGQLCSGTGKTLKLTVVRAGLPAPLTAAVTTDAIEVDPVEFRVLNGRVGYLRVRLFNARATREFQRAIDRVTGPLSGKLKGLIVDLRSNPGGVRADLATEVDGFTSARKLMARLTRGGNVATLERRPNVREPLQILGAKPTFTLPRIVLVDQGTANLSEMTAAALRDSGAKIVGTHTFGDDILSLFTVFKSGAGVEMTTAHLLTTTGTDLSKGLEPDVPMSSSDSASDAAIKMALLKLGV